MLVRTELRQWGMNERTDQVQSFLSALKRYGILVVPPNFLTVRPSWMPQLVHGAIIDMYKSGVLALRPAPSSFFGVTGMPTPWEASSPTRIEVVVARDQESVPIICELTDLNAYSDCYRVDRIRKLIEGDDFCDNRGELWRVVLEPLLDAMRPSGRKVTIVDRYLSDHVSNSQRGASGESGFSWLLECLNQNSQAADTRTSVELLSVLKNQEGARAKQVAEVFRRAGARFGHLDLRVWFVPEARFDEDKRDPLRDAFHQRFVLFGNHRGVILDKGLNSLSISSVRSEEEAAMVLETFRRSWVYRRELGAAVNPFVAKAKQVAEDYELAF
jgi:hypothetical protein